MGNSKSVSGTGSSHTKTKTLIQELPSIKITSDKKMIDAPCNDFNWMKYPKIKNYIFGLISSMR